MKNLVAFAEALADETRWRILQLVVDEPMCVCELADVLQMPQSSVSSHVQVIKKSGLLSSERCSKWIYYQVTPEGRALLVHLADWFQATPENHATLRRDAQKARKRLAERARSCCPLPQSLTQRNKNCTPS